MASLVLASNLREFHPGQRVPMAHLSGQPGLGNCVYFIPCHVPTALVLSHTCCRVLLGKSPHCSELLQAPLHKHAFMP